MMTLIVGAAVLLLLIPLRPMKQSDIRIHIIEKYQPQKSKKVNEKFLRLNRVSRFGMTGDNEGSPQQDARQSQLAFGDTVFIDCDKGHVLRGKSITGRVKWDTTKANKALKDTKGHFKIVGKFKDGSFLTAYRKFQLQSVHWNDCQLGSSTDPERPYKAGDNLVIANCHRGKARELNFFAKPMAVQPPPQNIITPTSRKFSKKCSHGYTKVAHRMACRSYLHQSSSGESSFNHSDLSVPTDIDIIV